MASYINQNIFFLIKNHHLVLWDYDAHKQYIISSNHLARLLYLSQNSEKKPDKNNKIDQELLDSGVLSEKAFVDIKWGWDDLSKIFHIGTSKIDYEIIPKNASEWARVYQNACEDSYAAPIPRLRHELGCLRDTHIIHLAHPCSKKEAGLHHALLKRRSVREFLPIAITKPQLESILYYSLAYLPFRSSEVSDLCPVELRDRRSSPSGGGLNAIQGYVYIRNVEQIPAGLYYYNPSAHQLELVGQNSDFCLGTALSGQFFAEDIPFGIFLACQFDRLWWKYPHSRAYRVALLDAGHISQSIQLIATSLGLSTWVSAAINEACLESVIGEINQIAPLLFVGAGFSTGRDMPEVLENLHASEITINDY